MTDKPPLPARLFDDWPRIAVDDTHGSATHRIIRLATGVGDDWALGPDGPFKRPELTLADIIHSAVREGLLHLLELGLIDIDSERLNAAKGVPTRRRDFRPATEEPQP